MLKSTLKVIAWNLGLILVVAVAAELVFGGWLRAPGMWNFAFYRDKDWRMYVEDHYDNGRQPIHYVRDYYGLRGDYGTPADVNLLILGGSTTDERFVTEGRTWPDTLGKCLREAGSPAAVANAGVTGQTLRGNAANFDLWLKHIPDLRPRYVVTLFGVNELFVDALEDKDDVRRFTEAAYPHQVSKTIRQWIRMNSALYQLFHTIKGNIAAYRAGIAVKPEFEVFGDPDVKQRGVDRVDAAYHARADRRVVPGTPEYDRLAAKAREAERDRVEAFRGRMHALSETVRAFGAVPVFVTQAWGTYRVAADGTVSGDVDRFFRMHAYYAAAMDFCRESGDHCIDLGEEISFRDGDFWDDAHTTPSGSERIGRHICRALLEWPEFRLPAVGRSPD